MNLPSAVAVANEIRMLRQQFKGTFLLVEGRDDRLMLEYVTDAGACLVKVGNGKGRVCEAVRILEGDGFEGILGIVDANLDRLEGVPVGSVNVLLTDDHDLDCMQLRSPAFDVLLREFGSQEKLGKFGPDIRAALLNAALPIACIRLYSRREHLHLCFDGLTYSKCVRPRDLAPDISGVIMEVKNRSNRQDISTQALREAIADIEHEPCDPWHLCNGTDLLGILYVALRSTLGTNHAHEVAEPVLRPVLRVAYRQHFLGSHLREQIEAWVQANAPFRVLPAA